MQKQLTALVEKGNLTVYALTEVECANNCVFYKNKKAYLKSINDVLDSIKDIAYENFHNKYNKNVFQYQEEQKLRDKEEEINKQKEKNEKVTKTKNFNRTVYKNNMKSFSQRYKYSKSLNKINKNNNNNENKRNRSIKQIKVINHNNQNIKDKDKVLDNGFDKFVPHKRFLQKINNEFNKEENNNINNENFDNNYEEQIDIKINSGKINESESININIANNINPNIIDLRGNIESQLIEELKHKKRYNNNEINDEINEKISNIKRFRNHGYLPQQNEYLEEKKVKKVKNKKFFSEFERRRFIKALKHIITERLGEHNIYIQNICNCGNLQEQLTALVEKGNLTVYALTEVECANNCVFYKNKKAYLKSINDVLNSIKDIAYENFHNKYKDKK